MEEALWNKCLSLQKATLDRDTLPRPWRFELYATSTKMSALLQLPLFDSLD